jgi:glycine/D-amino acid oxidase-like deaminating enzyme
MPQKSVDIAVIGGGLVGSALAWGLARGGAVVSVLDEGDDAFRASRGNFGLVWVQGKGDGMPEYAAWTRRSADLWRDLATTLRAEEGIDVGLRQPGGLEAFLTEDERDASALEIKRMHNQGLPDIFGAASDNLAQSGANESRIISAEEARALEPALGPDIIAAAFNPHDGHVSPLLLLRALHAGFRRYGVRYLPEHPVHAVSADGDGFRIETPRGVLHAGKVVLAAGLGNIPLAPMLGLEVPTKPNRGHVLVTERLAPLLRHPHVNQRQTEEGTVMIGASSDDVADTSLDIETSARLAARARKIMPCLAKARIVRTWSALRIMSPDGFPIYTESKTHPGAFVATCHSGVTLAAAHAFELAGEILRGGLSDRFAAFSPDRFSADRSDDHAQS